MELGVLQYISTHQVFIDEQCMWQCMYVRDIHVFNFSSIADMATELEDNQIYGVVTISQTAETSK